MGWADNHIRRLQAGETVQFRPRGSSMEPRISSGDLVTVEPIKDSDELTVSDIVLCTVRGSQYLHLIYQISEHGERLMIGNNRGHENGWTSYDKVYGRVTKVEP
jgi:signal peptidase I